jgi:hypothetical protein
MHNSDVEFHQQPDDPVRGALDKRYSGHSAQILPLQKCPPFGVDGLVDVCFTIAVLSESPSHINLFSLKWAILSLDG